MKRPKTLTWKEEVSKRLRKDASLDSTGSSTIRFLKVGLFIKFNTTGNNGIELLVVPRVDKGDEAGPIAGRRPPASWAISVDMLSKILGITLTTVCTNASIHCCTYWSFSFVNLSTAGSSLALQRDGSHRRLILHRSAAHTNALPRRISGPCNYISNQLENTLLVQHHQKTELAEILQHMIPIENVSCCTPKFAS